MNKKKIISTIIFLSLAALLILGLSRIFVDKKSEYYKAEFFNAKTDFDALYFGASRMHEGVDPVYLWENYGISSYNMASAGESIQMTYYVVNEALSQRTPKVIFIDSAKISDDIGEINSGYGFVHESIDALPFNANKLEAIKYAGRFFDGGKKAFLSMLYAYHGRYEELGKDDFIKPINYDKGAYIMTSVHGGEKPDEFTDEVRELKGGDGVAYYKKILELCKSKGIKCVLLDFPVSKDKYSLNRQKYLNALMKLTEENGGESIACNRMVDELGIDYEHDFGDTSHLNFYGAAKVADYIAAYMQNELHIEDHRGDSSYSEAWSSDIEKWNRQRVEMLADKKDAVEYLFGAMDDKHKIILYVKNTNKLYNHYGMDFCLDKLGIEPVVADEDKISGYDMKIEVRDSENDGLAAQQFFDYNESSGLYTAQ